jgi:hypothetical protein
MKLKVRSNTRFLSAIHDGVGTKIRKDGLATYTDLDYNSLEQVTSFDSSQKLIAIFDKTTGIWNKTTMSALLSGSGYAGTSLTSAPIGVASVVFQTQAGLAYLPGTRARVSSAANLSNYMEGIVTAYSGYNLTLNVSSIHGSGTHADWNLSLAGDPGAGDMLSTNNGLDFSNLPTTLTNLGGVSFGATQALNAAQKLKARQNINVSSAGALNILDFGGVGDGVTANDAAFNAAWSALGTMGGCIYFPAGKYLFSSQIGKTLPNARFALTISGDGIDATTLYWPNANGGIQLTAGSGNNSVFIKDMSLTTSQVGSGQAIYLIGKAQGNNPTSEIHNVQVCGADLNGTATSTQYWFVAIHIHGWSAVNLINTNTYGPFNPTPYSAGGGVGLLLEGDIPTALYITLIQVQQSSFNGHIYGIELGDFWQGITIGATQFNGGVAGQAGIYQISGTVGIQTQLAITNCEFAYNGTQVKIAGAVSNIQLIGNQIGSNPITYALSLSAGTIYTNVVGNFFTGPATGSGMEIFGASCVVTGNVFSGFASGFGITLQSGASNNTIGINNYTGVGTKVANGSGNSSNSIGTAAVGNMAGVVP